MKVTSPGQESMRPSGQAVSALSPNGRYAACVVTSLGGVRSAHPWILAWGRLLTVGALLSDRGSAASGRPGSAKSTGSAAKPGIATFAVGSPSAILHTGMDASFAGYNVVGDLYDPLVTFNQTGKVVLDLATIWTATVNSGTCHTRTGVTCSEGITLTPADASGRLVVGSRRPDASNGLPFSRSRERCGRYEL
ncbi:MAG: hypothetical protein ACYCWN_13535 [Ferrimicrobium sp.]